MSEADRRLSEESEQRFLDLYAHLLVYVNDRFEVIEEIETVADLEQHYTDELLPLRNALYRENKASASGLDPEAVHSQFFESKSLDF